MTFTSSVHAKAMQLIRISIEMTTEAGSGHPSSAASLAHLVTFLVHHHMRFDPARPDDPAGDRLVLSEGHACPIVYAAAADLGIAIGRDRRRPMSREDAMDLRRIGSEVDGHPNPAEGFPFFPAATGSLGQGLSVAAGLAIAARLDGRDQRIFCIIGDGESREGQIWEAADLIVDRGLVAVCPIFNCNEFGQTGEVSDQQSPGALERKLDAFGFEALRIDGHDPDQIARALERHATAVDARPVAIVAETRKGFGTPILQGEGHHGKPVPEEDLEQALRELEETASRVGAAWDEGALKVPPLPETTPRPEPRREPAPATLQDAMERYDERKDELAPRRAFGLALRALGHARPEVVVLDGDVGNSTGTGRFAHDADLGERFVQCFIAEQNMVSCAAGLAAGGKSPFVASFGKFLARAYDQIEMAMVGRFALRLVGSHVGVSLAADGPSQMALPDVAYFRALSSVTDDAGAPLFHVLTPCDAVSAYALTLEMAEHPASTYLRCFRPDVPFVHEPGRFPIGGHRMLTEGPDLMIGATGYMVHEALKAHRALEQDGIRATLVDLYSLPFDGDAVAALAEASGRRVVTVEDHYGSPVGDAVTDALADRNASFRVERMGVRRVPKSGRTPGDVLRHLGLSADDIAARARRLVEA